MPCPKCGGPMYVKKRITFAEGPAKLVFECSRAGCTGTAIASAPSRSPRDPS